MRLSVSVKDNNDTSSLQNFSSTRYMHFFRLCRIYIYVYDDTYVLYNFLPWCPNHWQLAWALVEEKAKFAMNPFHREA